MDYYGEIVVHEGYPVLLEKEPIELLKIPVNGDKLHESVLLHPRYAVPKVKYETIKVRGHRRGRTIDILLEEPLKKNGKIYRTLSVKGVGARGGTGEMVIHPTKWYSTLLGWIERESADKYGRVFGAVQKRKGMLVAI